MCRALLDPPLTSLPQSTPTSSSLLFPSHWPATSTSQTELLFGRCAEQSPITGYEPSALVEVSSTEAPPMKLPSRKGSLGSTCDDLATPPAASEVGKRSDLGMMASPLFLQGRETSANQSRIYHSNRQSSGTSFSRFRSGTGKPAARSQHRRKLSRDSGVVQDSHSEREKFF